ncbi:hypothetical protein, partial [Dyadobacter frigoris]|uniref:hypothetical protein n=1 Tax=Dyadobacter frigoris TaxID=2576211 RepID=UPI00255643B5
LRVIREFYPPLLLNLYITKEKVSFSSFVQGLFTGGSQGAREIQGVIPCQKHGAHKELPNPEFIGLMITGYA